LAHAVPVAALAEIDGGERRAPSAHAPN